MNFNLNAGFMFLNYMTMIPGLGSDDPPIIVFYYTLGNKIVEGCFEEILSIPKPTTRPEKSIVYVNGAGELKWFEDGGFTDPVFIAPRFISLLPPNLTE